MSNGRRRSRPISPNAVSPRREPVQRVAEEVIKGPTKAYPGIPEPFDVSARTLYPTVEALKLAVDTLIRHRGAFGDSAVLVEDLNRLIEYLDRRYVLDMGGDITVEVYSAAITDNAGNGTVAGDCAATDFTGNKYARDQALFIQSNHLVTFTHKDIAYLWVGPAPVSVGIGGSYTPAGTDFAAVGTSDHTVLSNRDTADQHPQTAIGGRSGGGSDLKLDQDIQDGRLGNLETWREAHEPGVNPHGMMRWAGQWAPGQYLYHDVVLDFGYLAIANKNTGDRPSPQPAGAAFFVYDGAAPTSSITAKQLTVGQRYTLQQDAFLNAFRIYTVTGNRYRVYAVTDPLGTPIIKELLSAFEAGSTGWQTFAVDQVIGLEGDVFDLYVAMEEPDPTPTVWTGNWGYDTPNNPGAPGAGVIQHANQDLANLRVAKLDNDGGDRAVEIAALTPGDIIEALGVRWAVQTAPSDQGTWFLIAVAPASQATPDGVTQFSFEVVEATPITVVADADYWLGLASIVGRYQIDGGAWVESEDQYSIDLQIQALTLSEDWDLLSVPGGGGGGGSTDPPAATAWGDIFGNLADQTDLQAALDNKRDVNQGSTFG